MNAFNHLLHTCTQNHFMTVSPKFLSCLWIHFKHHSLNNPHVQLEIISICISGTSIKYSELLFMPTVWIVPSHLKHILLSERMSCYMQLEFTEWAGWGWAEITFHPVVSYLHVYVPAPELPTSLCAKACSCYRQTLITSTPDPEYVDRENTSSIAPSLFDIRYRPYR